MSRQEDVYLSVTGFLLLFSILLGASALRIWALLSAPMDYYEATAVAAATRGMGISEYLSPLTTFTASVFGIPFQMAGSAIWMRGVSALMGIVILLPLFSMGRELHSERAGLAAAFFGGFMPMLFFHSVRVGDTIVAASLLALSMYLYRELLWWAPDEKDRQAEGNLRGLLIKTTLSSAALSVSHFAGLLFLLPLLALWLVAPANPRLRRHEGLWPLSLGLILGGIALYRSGLSAGVYYEGLGPWNALAERPWAEILGNLAMGWNGPNEFVAYLAAVLGFLCIAGAVGLAKQPRILGAALVWALGVPAALWATGLLAARPSPEDLLAVALPGACLLAGIGIGALPGRTFQITGTGIAALLMTTGLQREAAPLAAQPPPESLSVERRTRDYRSAARALIAMAGDDDAIVHTSPKSAEIMNALFNFEMYQRTPMFTLDLNESMKARYYGRYTDSYLRPPRSLRIWGRIAQANVITHHFERIWFIESQWNLDPDPWEKAHEERLRAWLFEHYRKADTMDLHGVPVSLYVVKTKVAPQSFQWGNRPEALNVDMDALLGRRERVGQR